jgi:hypothetical protein
MRVVVRRPVSAPVDAVRRALSDPAGLIDTMAPRLEPLPPEPGMVGHWRARAPLAGTAREFRIWLPAPGPADGCIAAARMDGVSADLSLAAEPDGARSAWLRAEVTVAAAGLRGRALLALLALSEPALRSRLETVLDRLSAHVAAPPA